MNSKEDFLTSETYTEILELYIINFTFLKVIFLEFFKVSVNVHEVPEELWMEIIDLQHDAVLKDQLFEVGTRNFYQFLDLNYCQLKTFASKIWLTFGTTYVSEQFFSVINVNKSEVHSQHIDTHLNSTLRIPTVTAQRLTPDFDVIIQSYRWQLSKTFK